MKNKNRIVGIDIVRFFAIFFVLGIHTIGLLGFQSQNINNTHSIFKMLLYRFTWMCVPLFLILTGYLNFKKEGNKTYFKSLIKTVMIFLFYCIVVLLFRIFYLREDISLWNGIKIILNNSTQDRAWYMNMYFGLIFIIPFINAGWKRFNKEQKIIIICILFGLTSVSKYIFNITNYFFQIPFIFVSSYWWELYYLVYYFIGAFIHEYPIKISKKYIIIFFSIIIVGHTFVYYIVGQGKIYSDIFLAKTFWYDNPILMIEASLFFIIVYNIDLKNKIAKLIVNEISLSALEMYLFSIVSDTICFSYFNNMLANHSYLIVVSLMWPSSFIISFLVALARRKIVGLSKLFILARIHKNRHFN